MNLGELQSLAKRVRDEIGKAVHGQDEVVELLLVGMFARGHCLIEGPPGTAKTLLAQSLAAAVQIKFGRIQFTPDLMPGDVLGANIFDFRKAPFTWSRGRSSPSSCWPTRSTARPRRRRRRSSRRCRSGSPPSTASTISSARISSSSPRRTRSSSRAPIRFPRHSSTASCSRSPSASRRRRRNSRSCARHSALPLDHAAHGAGVVAVATREELTAARILIDGVRLDESILAYALALTRATRSDSEILQGGSTRAADALCAAVRALAALDGRDYAIPDDVKRLYPPVMRHRVVLAATAEIEGRTADDVLANIVNQVEAPNDPAVAEAACLRHRGALRDRVDGRVRALSGGCRGGLGGRGGRRSGRPRAQSRQPPRRRDGAGAGGTVHRRERRYRRHRQRLARRRGVEPAARPHRLSRGLAGRSKRCLPTATRARS